MSFHSFWLSVSYKYLLQFIFRCGWRYSEDVVELRIDNIGHGVAVAGASTGRWMDKETEPVENVLLASCLRFRKAAPSVPAAAPWRLVFCITVDLIHRHTKHDCEQCRHR